VVYSKYSRLDRKLDELAAGAELRSLSQSVCGMGIRMTDRRLPVLAYLLAQRRSVTVREIYQGSIPAGHCDASTTYRFLMQLKDAGLLREVNSATNESAYCLDPFGQCVDYLICQKCLQVIPLGRLPEVDEFQNRIALEAGFSSVSRRLEFFGICPGCANVQVRSGK